MRGPGDEDGDAMDDFLEIADRAEEDGLLDLAADALDAVDDLIDSPVVTNPYFDPDFVDDGSDPFDGGEWDD
jgi:hypothetical protein